MFFIQYEIKLAYCDECVADFVEKMRKSYPSWFNGKRIINLGAFEGAVKLSKDTLLKECFVYSPESVKGISLCSKHLRQLSDEVKGKIRDKRLQKYENLHKKRR